MRRKRNEPRAPNAVFLFFFFFFTSSYGNSFFFDLLLVSPPFFFIGKSAKFEMQWAESFNVDFNVEK